ncbi:Ubx7p NDAI_0B04710 [Naumovozyma dairenensis CBS 421]|uniref:UBX domain-containing protein n=1 Tax=Naumovozyma dairenensis (strain ATCC 10597 / BCRC 20456 / CBS 421 / NBRC 0211 / NRRL Y-12639) TaxID=1071378 RepID=G0W6U5_NAUDC|nr:hypothetical protein NDAI_0B04710 [Naumovozyma dairenensis CBS 421]CCD23506.1 hypothetical protein NDAI_0B04710 [Naumovozyma dairenensis CBS 421]
MLDKLFMDNVEQSVAQSLQKKLPLVVYSCESLEDDSWFKQWFHMEKIDEIKDHAIWLRLIKGTEQFNNFEQLFPSVIIPSLYLINNGELLSVIQGVEDDHTHWEDLLSILGVGNNQKGKDSTNRKTAHTHDNDKKSNKEKEKFGKSDREDIMETSERIYHQQVLKERRLENEERERIIRLVRADRQERKAKEQKGILDDSKPLEVVDNFRDINKLHSEKCTLQIKLTNSSTLTHTFNSKDTLNDVRTWVDHNRTDGNTAYYFHRNIPRMTFNDSDELKTLCDLELTPRSALILKVMETSTTKINSTNIEKPSLVSKVFNGISGWWNKTNRNEPVEFGTSNFEPYHDEPSDDDTSRNASFGDISYGNNIKGSNTRVSELAKDEGSSRTNSNSRAVSPNVFQFVNRDDMEDQDDKEKETFNGNNINLEKNKDDSSK